MPLDSVLPAALVCVYAFSFFFNDTATTEIYTLSLHDALPIYVYWLQDFYGLAIDKVLRPVDVDRKSTRLNSSHGYISYAVFCLKKQKTHNYTQERARRSSSRISDTLSHTHT